MYSARRARPCFTGWDGPCWEQGRDAPVPSTDGQSPPGATALPGRRNIGPRVCRTAGLVCRRDECDGWRVFVKGWGGGDVVGNMLSGLGSASFTSTVFVCGV